MKKIVLLGDSIRLIGYGKKVEEALRAEGHQVWQPDTNCRFVKHTLRMLFDEQENIKNADVIHWNNGLWDMCDLFGDGPFSSIEEYVANMTRIADLLFTFGKKVIFATTTPTHPECPHHENARIAKYNAALVPELERKGVLINDLYALMENDIEKGICEDKIHLSEWGKELCGDQVLQRIREVI